MVVGSSGGKGSIDEIGGRGGKSKQRFAGLLT